MQHFHNNVNVTSWQRPAKEVAPAHAVAVDDEEIVLPNKRGTSPVLLFFVVVVIGAAGFVAGRMTADVPLPGFNAPPIKTERHRADSSSARMRVRRASTSAGPGTP